VFKRRTYLQLHWRKGRARLEITSGRDTESCQCCCFWETQLPPDITGGVVGGEMNTTVNKASLIPLVNVCWKSDKTDSVANSKLLMASGHPGNENGETQFWNEVAVITMLHYKSKFLYAESSGRWIQMMGVTSARILKSPRMSGRDPRHDISDFGVLPWANLSHLTHITTC
jgi:hypothetical protein